MRRLQTHTPLKAVIPQDEPESIMTGGTTEKNGSVRNVETGTQAWNGE
jgi:hypothetical protein